jgi:hypothetical protein
MSVNSIAYDSGGFGQWLSLRDPRAGPSISGSANDVGAWLGTRFARFGGGQAVPSGPPPWSSPTAAATNAAGAGAAVTSPAGAPPNWLGSTENAASRLIGDLQAFLVDLQTGGGGGGTNGGADTTATVAPAATATAPATGAPAGPTATGAVATTDGTQGDAGPDTATAGTTSSTGSTASNGGSTASDAASLIGALQSFIDQLQGGSTNQAPSAGTTTAQPPWDTWPNQDAGGRHDHHDAGGGWRGGSDGIAGELQTTNQLLGQILGAIESYSAQGNQITSQTATTSVSA